LKWHHHLFTVLANQCFIYLLFYNHCADLTFYLCAKFHKNT
jgi:hypothetical protein